MNKRLRIGIILIAVISRMSVALCHGGDWPQILGPDRNGVASGERLADKWPSDKPRRIWEKRIGSGFAGVAVSQNTVILFHRENDQDELTALDAETGKSIWATSYPSTFQSRIVEDSGPRAVPTIHDGSVFAYSAQGGLYCVDLKTGQKRWERKTHREFGAVEGYFGAGCSPLVDGNRVIVIVGGDKKKAGVVAFDAETGKTIWSAVDDQASYSAPVITTQDDVRHLFCITRLNFVSLDPTTGTERFRTPFGKRGPTVNAALPLISGKHVLLTASYGIGARWLEFGSTNVDVIWSDEILSSQYTTPILHDGALYGIDGRQDQGTSTLKCFDLNTRRTYWLKSGLNYATLIGADGKLLIMQTDGQIKVIRLSKTGYEELNSASLLPGTARALPALANGRFYVRNENTLVCVDLSEQ